MSYSLTNAPALGFELAHVPAGATVARILLAGLSSDAVGLAQMAFRIDQVDRGRICDAAGADHRPVQLREASELLAEDADTHAIWSFVRGSRLGDAQQFERMVRTEIFGRDCSALHMLPDGWHGWVRDALVAEASQAWTSSTPWMWGGDSEGEATLDGSSDGHLVDGALILDLLLHLASTEGWRSGRSTNAQAWAGAMHSASWAIHLAGRQRASAKAQLAGVLAFRQLGFGLAQVASGMWNALSGVLQADVVADLLDEDSLGILFEPLDGLVERLARGGAPDLV